MIGPPFFLSAGRKTAPVRNGMKKIAEECVLSEEQQNSVKRLAAACGISELTARILFSRGIETPEDAARFLSPSKKHFLSPFLMRGMKELAAALAEAKNRGDTVVVFGDYDADGVCASSILVSALREFGVHCAAYIPERTEGYGMNEAALQKLIDEHAPALIVTVDCGISNKQEVEYIKSRGVTPIVTDHHELPDELPDCVIVNPKLKDDYPYDNLCGAGVAFKIACALLGERAYALLDLAAIATVADSVPLTGENRDIVYEGLRLINRKPRPAVKYLLATKQDEASAQTLAFTIAPRINAAGRMGDANSALRLFTSENAEEVYELACRLNAYNMERQQVCDEVYKSAKEKIAREECAYDSAILLYDEGWSAGLVGIVAAKISEEFNRPAILFVKNGDILKGSARTIDNINIYEALKNCSEYIEEFGGHSQAAGVKVREENFPAFKRALCALLDCSYTREDFIPTVYVAADIDFRLDLRLAKELERLEPCGVGNRKPLFSLSVGSVRAKPLKEGSPHISVKADEAELIWFGGAKAAPLLEADIDKKLVFECDVSRFRGEEYVRGIVKDMICGQKQGELSRRYIFRNNLLRLTGTPARVAPVRMTAEQIKEEIAARRAACSYGLLLAASEGVPAIFRESVAGLDEDMFSLASSNVGNAVLISPAGDTDLAYYREVIFLDTPADFNIPALEGKKVLVNGELCGYNSIARLDVARDTLGEIYREIRKLPSAENSVALAEMLPAYPAEEVIFAAEVFAELGLLRFENGGIAFPKGKRSELGLSALYRAVCALKER